MWNTIAEKFIIAVEKLEDVVVGFAGIKISSFSREDGEIFLDSFDDTLVSVKFHNLIIQQFFNLK
jgi:hypothetical protein